MLQAGTLICAKYEVVREIGRGGMSVVYLARDYVSGKFFAIKDVERNGEENNRVVVQSLAGEGRLLKNLSNPYLPRIYDIIEDKDSIMVVMEYIEGTSLDRVIKKNGAQPEADVYRWGMQICEVFDYLHSQIPPIIYRDMKPANLMLLADGSIKIIDFGTARTQKVGMVMHSDTVCIGTEGFAAPEQFGGISQSDARTDIFCLGATLYNLVTGHSPCDRPKGIRPLEEFVPELSQSPLNDIIAKCTRNDPDERYQTAMELHEALRLASLGQLKRSKKRGTERLRKLGWQKQTVKDANGNGGTGALSGLLGKSEKLRQAQQAQYAAGVPKETAADAGRNSGVCGFEPVVPLGVRYAPQETVALFEQETACQEEAKRPPAPKERPVRAESKPPETEQSTGSVWRRLFLIAAVTTVVLFLAAAGCLIFEIQVAAYVLLVAAAGAVVLMIVGLCGTLK